MPTVPSSGPWNAKLAVVGMAPADEEVRTGVPLVGPSGKILNYALAKNGIERRDVFVTNIVDHPIPKGTSVLSLPADQFKYGVNRVKAELEQVAPNCIITLGDDPLRVLCDLKGVMKWRGSIVSTTILDSKIKVVPTVHPAWLLRGFSRWISVFTGVDIARGVEESKYPEFIYPERREIIGPTFELVMDYIESCYKHPYLSIDFETIGNAVTCIGIGYSANEALCIPLSKAKGVPYFTREEEASIWQAFARLMEAEYPAKIAQNASYEWIICWRHGIYPRNLFIDTMYLHHCLYLDFGGGEDHLGKKKKVLEFPGHNLAFINSQYTKTPYYKEDRKVWKRGELTEHRLWSYNCKDVMVTYDAAMQMHDEAKQAGVWDYYIQRYNEMFLPMLRIEWDGIRIDTKLRAEAEEKFITELERLKKEVRDLGGIDLKARSSKQVKHYMYDVKKYPKVYKLAKGIRKETADKNAVEALAIRFNDPILFKILEIRKVEDIISDVINQQLDKNDHVHTHYNLSGTSGERYSSSKSILGSGANLQNIQRGGIARSLYIAED